MVLNQLNGHFDDCGVWCCYNCNVLRRVAFKVKSSQIDINDVDKILQNNVILVNTRVHLCYLGVAFKLATTSNKEL